MAAAVDCNTMWSCRVSFRVRIEKALYDMLIYKEEKGEINRKKRAAIPASCLNSFFFFFFFRVTCFVLSKTSRSLVHNKPSITCTVYTSSVDKSLRCNAALLKFIDEFLYS